MARSRDRIDARAVRHKKKKHYDPLPKALACMVAACFAADAALANPVGPVVVNGQVSFARSGSQLSIVNTPGSIINWQSFSVGVGELTRFIQQSASSTVLNRVVGVDPSQILGALQSNGRVFLINPNGILFGAGSRIDVGGLVASTLNFSNQDFLNGKLNFTATSDAGSIINQGAITTPTGGQVYLIAPSVQNSGIIQSPQGEIVLAAGHSVELVDAGTPDLMVEVTASSEQAVNLGKIVADSGRIGIYAGLIKNNGTVQANTVVAGQSGQILLVATNSAELGANSKITATGQTTATTGGTVEVTGNAVVLAGGSTIDVSGQNGGGAIFVGGGEHGADPNVPDAQTTTVESGANLIANAINNGNGGTVIVWSDGTTQFDGYISAQGGAQGGNGGFAEVSGEQNLYLTGHADLSAVNGKAGTLLLDPGTVTIIDGAEGNNSNTFQDTYISAQLGVSNVTITTASGSVDPEDINFDSDVTINWSTGNTLEFDAGHDINQAGNILASNPASVLILNPGNALTVAGNITAGTVELSSGTGNVTQTGGTITAQNMSVVSNNDVLLTGANAVGILAGSVGTLNFNDVGPLVIGDVNSTYGGTGDPTQSTEYGVTAFNGSLDISTTGFLTVNQPVQVSGSTAGQSVSATLAGNGILIDGGPGGSVYATARSGDEDNPGGNATITLTSGNGGILLDNGASVSAQGGHGGFTDWGTGGAGGDASITLTSTSGGGITIQNSSYVHAEGGEGGDSNDEAGTGGTGGAASVALNGGSGQIKLDTSGEIAADGGEGGGANNNGGAGGLATVSLITTNAIVIQGGSEISAHGGGGGEGENNNGGNGGNASIILGDGTNTGITINNGSVSAVGGDGGESEGYLGTGGTGGSAIVALNAGGSGILIENSTGGPSVQADGGEGGYGSDPSFGGNGGGASITLTAPSNITLQSGGGVFASGGNGNDGGEGGGNGGNAAIAFNAAAISISSPNYVEVEGGQGQEGYDSELGGNGGSASLALAATGAISIDSANVEVSGGEGTSGAGGSGGTGNIAFNAGGPLSLSNSTVTASGGEGSLSDGNARITMSAQGPVNILASSSVEAETSAATPTISITSVSGNIDLTDSSITTQGESGNDFIGMLAGVDIDVLDSSVLSSDGSIALAATNLNVTANNDTSSVEAGEGTLTAVVLDNISVTGGSNSSTPAFIGGYSGVSLFLGNKTSQIQLTAGTGDDSYAQVVTAVPGTIDVTYLGRTNGGYSVDGQSGVVTDASTESGFYTSPDLVAFTPAVVGNNLFFNYFGTNSSNNESEIPLAVTAALDFIFGEINDPFQGEETRGNKGESREDKKKNSCS